MRAYPLIISKLMRAYLNFFSFSHGTRLATHMASNNLLIIFLSLVIKTLPWLGKFPTRSGIKAYLQEIICFCIIIRDFITLEEIMGYHSSLNQALFCLTIEKCAAHSSD